jgi:hypothetical protein
LCSALFGNLFKPEKLRHGHSPVRARPLVRAEKKNIDSNRATVDVLREGDKKKRRKTRESFFWKETYMRF